MIHITRGIALAAFAGCAGMVAPGCSTQGASAEAVDIDAARIVFGPDDRLEHGQLTDPALLGWSAATAALFSDGRMSCSGASCALAVTPYTHAEVNGASLTLCPEERFQGQPRGAECTAFLVAEDLVATAGHCVESQARCDELNVVFGFTADERGEAARTTVSRGDVYGCVDLIAQTFPGGPSSDDWALFRVDRPVAGRAPLGLRREGSVPESARLVTIGHSLSLPLKIATNGAVRENVASLPKFSTNLDVSPGSSGSPVIDSGTGLVEGILTSGPTPDWEAITLSDGTQCALNRRCDEVAGCGGGPFPEWTDATRISGVVAALEGRSCHDDTLNGAETDVDCGGPDCPACELGQGCSADRDCPFRSVCEGSTCVPAPECVTDAQCLDPRAAACIVATCVQNRCNLDFGACECRDNAECDDGRACTEDLCFARTLSCVHIESNCPSACTEATAVDLGASGQPTTVPNNGCVRVRDGYPGWWGDARPLLLQTRSPGTYPVPFTWTNACAGASGSGQFTGDWQTQRLAPTSDDCATLIHLNGDGSGNVTLAYFGG